MHSATLGDTDFISLGPVGEILNQSAHAIELTEVKLSRIWERRLPPIGFQANSFTGVWQLLPENS